MTSKQRISQLIEQLPDDASIDDVMEGLYLLAKLEKAEQEIDQGLGVSHEQVAGEVESWLSQQRRSRMSHGG